MASATVEVDLTKAMHEAERMAKGEIAYNQDYLMELIEFPGDIAAPVDFEFLPACEECSAKAVWTDCPECKILRRADCGLCEGHGGFWECPNCSKDDGTEFVGG